MGWNLVNFLESLITKGDGMIAQAEAIIPFPRANMNNLSVILNLYNTH